MIEGAPNLATALARSYQQWRRAVARGAVKKGIVNRSLVESALDTPAERKAQDRAFRELTITSIMAAKMAGLKREEIAQQFNVTANAVTSFLAEGQRLGLLDAAKDLMVGNLMPKALATYATHLDQNNLEAARDVLTSVGIINTKGPAAGILPAQLQEGEISITQVRARLAGARSASPPTPTDADVEGVEGDLLSQIPEGGLRLLEGAIESDLPE